MTGDYFDDLPPVEDRATIRNAADLARLRRKQAKAVMPLIGPLMDRWEGLPNDVKSDLRRDHPELWTAMELIVSAVND